MCLGTCGEAARSLGFAPAGPVRSQPLTAARLEQMQAAKAARAERAVQRERRIDELCAVARDQGQIPDRGYWMLVYDFEMAPSTNGRTMLLELGVVPVPPQDLSEDSHLHEALWTVIEGLAANGVYLLNTDHLTDRQLYDRLFYKILDEPTHSLPPASGSCEYIDVLHEMDIDAGGHGAELNERLLHGTHPPGEFVVGARAPQQSTVIGDRDRYLPRPPGSV